MKQHESALRAVMLAALIVSAVAGGLAPAAAKAAMQRVGDRLSRIRVPFVANSGQIDSRVAYYASIFAGTLFVTQDGKIVYSLQGQNTSTSTRRASGSSSTEANAGASSALLMRSSDGWSLTETFIGGSAHPTGANRAASHVSYLLGNDPAHWRSGLSTFDALSLGEVWPGISLDLRAGGKNVEKLFVVQPGADPSRIRVKLAGAQRLQLDQSGVLVVVTGLGDVTFTAPSAYQNEGGVRRPIEVAYEVDDLTYGFRLGEHDPTLPVFIDPLLQATYLGGGGLDQGYALAIHPTTGDIYVAGLAASTDFPGTAGGAQVGKGTKNDAFIARLDSTLTVLTQATYLGGSNDDQAFALAIDPTSGDVYVAGTTLSTDFPGTAGGAQASNNAGLSQAAFVARLNASLTTLDQATYFGGGVTVAYALAIHPTTGNVYAAGSTIFSVLPGTTGGAQAETGGAVDGFVANFNSALTTLNKATYLGGGGGETAHGIAIHPTSGEVYVTGDTSSSNFPGTTGGAQAVHGVDFGNSDAFVARLNAALTAITQATYLGGNNQETGQAIAIHPTTGDVYVAGWTESSNFPGTSGGAQATYIPLDDVFVARLNATLTTLAQSTYLGTAGANRAFALAIHPTSGDVYAAGQTTGSFPGTSGGAQPMFGGFQDAFVAHLNPTLTTLDRATFLGGDSTDIAEAMAIDATTGNVYVSGYTFSTNFPGTAGGAQAMNGGSYDAFVARLTPDLASPTATTPLLVGATSRKVHGAAGMFDLALNAVATSPTTEPRFGPAQMLVFTFDKAVTAGTATVTEGTATVGAPTFSGNAMTVPLTGVANQQYVTVEVSNVVAADGGTGGAGSIRVGFLAGDVSQNRVVTVSDLALVNAQVAQSVTVANFLKDVNASGTLSVADKGLTNAQVTKALPAP